jgi:dsRNA-specific ribonuclease
VTYCNAKNLSLVFQQVASKRIGKQDIRTEEVVVGGKYRAKGTATSRKKAQAAAAEALIRSGILSGFAEFE